MRILITAGPTREPIDAVRYVSNRSSGLLGVALAHAGVEAGHQVTLLLGDPSSADAHGGGDRTRGRRGRGDPQHQSALLARVNIGQDQARGLAAGGAAGE